MGDEYIFRNNNSHYKLPAATFPIMKNVFKMFYLAGGCLDYEDRGGTGSGASGWNSQVKSEHCIVNTRPHFDLEIP